MWRSWALWQCQWSGVSCVKPLAIIRWLARLVTPPGGVILDPFMGSGTTGAAAAMEGFAFIGCEREAEYIAIAEARIAHWSKAAAPAPRRKKRAPEAHPAALAFVWGAR